MVLAVDIAIIGAGPAGLAAANVALLQGASFFVIERAGAVSARDIAMPEHAACGVGGAGLYCDGKLSYFPSAQRLWSLPSTYILEKGFAWIHNLISDFSSDPPSFPTQQQLDSAGMSADSTAPYFKTYESLLLSPHERDEFLARLLRPVDHRILSNSKVIRIVPCGSDFLLSLDKIGRDQSIHSEILAKRVIFCGGRLSPLELPTIIQELRTRFLRFEYGIRVQQPFDKFFLRHELVPDPKLIIPGPEDRLQWRTFCCCKRGTVLPTQPTRATFFSGTIAPASEQSNVGFNVRITDQALFQEVREEANALSSGRIPAYNASLSATLDACASRRLFGGRLDEFMEEGLRQLAQAYDLSDAEVFSPCLEGTGEYPALSADLETDHAGMYVAGDATGHFRGLMAALLSGYYCATKACATRFSSAHEIISEVSIKKSSISRMPLVFTAQSKNFFYCRDAICQYALERGFLPINPFRVFDYFLGDRVSRDLIRQGNNRLVRTCDELWVFGRIADGVLFEIAYASNLGKPIRFFTIGTTADDITPIVSIGDVVFESEVHAPRVKREELHRAIANSFCSEPLGHMQLELPMD